MKEFVERLIGMLEELKQTQVKELCEHKDFTSEMQSMRGFNILQDAIKIVNQLAEEMGVSKMENTTQTNADRIRSMSDEELAEFLINFNNTFGEEHEGQQSCVDWLQSEVKGSE